MNAAERRFSTFQIDELKPTLRSNSVVGTVSLRTKHHTAFIDAQRITSQESEAQDNSQDIATLMDLVRRLSHPTPADLDSDLQSCFLLFYCVSVSYFL